MLLITLFLFIGFLTTLPFSIVTNNIILEIITITLGVSLYHFVMRLLVGTIVNSIMNNKGNPGCFWFREKSFEDKLYKFLRVRNWKKYVPTYDPEIFNTSNKSVEELIGATCQAELVHEVIIVLSLAPILLIPFLGGAIAFIVTSILSMLIDLVFVIIQRYNRPRLIRVKSRFDRLK